MMKITKAEHQFIPIERKYYADVSLNDNNMLTYICNS